MAWKNDQRRRTYQCWQDMRQRCHNPKNHNFKNYGGRGISICQEWTTFEGFLSSMGLKPDGLTLERKDNDAGYSPANCRWATRMEQRRNQRTCRYVELNGRRMTLREAATEIGMHETTLQQRMDYRGMTFEQAISTPIMAVKSSRLRAIAAAAGGS
jgi:hypothetical protein